MKTTGIVSTAFAAAAFLAKSAVADVPPIVIKGSKFFYENNGTQFYIKGVAYQQEYSANATDPTTGDSTNTEYKDPLADADSCKRDIPYLVQLGTNAIRVYAVNPESNHDECMNALADAGIYVIADLSAPGDSIIRSSPTWNDDLYARYTSVVDNLAKYTNTLGFFAGNEVSNNQTNTDASAFVKAAVRDMKAYIKQKNYRTIGVGYATNDDADIRENLANYFDCGDRADAVDFWGYNIYSWCGDSSFQESGYDVRTKEFSDFDIPVFFAEYGCNEVKPREFTDVPVLYGEEMEDVWSGGIVYMYFQEANDYGLVTLDGNSVSTLADFNNLASQIAKISPTGVNSADYNPSNTAAQACPTVGAEWGASSDLPPTPNQELCECMEKALNCVPNNVADDEVGDLFGVVCGLGNNVCDGIRMNATTGEYGAYGMCNAQQQLGWALNVYYRQQAGAGNGANACDFGGSATTQSVVSPTGQCKTLIDEAGTNGQGTVTSVPTSISGGGSSGSSGSGSGSGSSNAASGLVSHPSTIGFMHVALYVAVAFTSGMGMIFL